jgi:hypothetical protein
LFLPALAKALNEPQGLDAGAQAVRVVRAEVSDVAKVSQEFEFFAGQEGVKTLLGQGVGFKERLAGVGDHLLKEG